MSTVTQRFMPLPPLLLGLSGLIPFWACALALVAHGALGLSSGSVDVALATYAAVILSFLGGIRWGFAVRDGAGVLAYGISVAPSLVGWGLIAAPEPWRLACLGLSLLALGPIDLSLVRQGAAPTWFGRLRLILAIGAGAAMLTAAFAIR